MTTENKIQEWKEFTSQITEDFLYDYFDDNNPDYIKTIRTSNEEDYKESFDIFKSEYIDELKSILESDSFDEEETKLLNELIIFIENEEPSFYDVEASS